MELLSPAGNLETALAAFDGGADAVYCGLGRFNARERAENFTPDTFGKLLEFARCNDKKIYLTLNTLVWEKELGMLFEQLLFLEKFPPDALIVQDPGIVGIVRKYFPQLPLHASTQMGIHNSAGVKIAEKLNFKRVILERQITLDELRQIARSTTLELEVFLHGSLCCSLSGRCLLSNHLYGESGNRGRCKQPCRRAFSGKAGNDLRILSPADLAGNSILDELDKLKIASLKIEGRLRTPDYIWKTARAYRILLDNPGDHDAVKEAENLFRTVPGRRNSTGFYFSKEWKNLISPALSGTFGECAATVKKVIRAGMMVKVLTSLHLGDRLRVMPVNGGEGESFTLAALENNRKEKLIRGRSGETLFIPGSFHAASGYEIRRIGENGFDFSRRSAALPPYRRRLEMKIFASPEKWQAEIHGINAVWEEKTAFAPAEKVPLTEETLQTVFAEALPDGFYAGKIDIELQGNFFVPAGILKSLRRNCWEFFTPHLAQKDFFAGQTEKMEDFYAETNPAEISVKSSSPLPENCFIIPPFIPENQLHEVKNKISAAYRAGCRDFAATGWHAFELLENLKDNVTIHAVYPFHISNSFAVKLANSLGANTISITPECESESAELLKNISPLPVKNNTAPIPLLVSRLPLTKGVWLLDEKRKFWIEHRDKMAYLYAHESFEVSG